MSKSLSARGGSTFGGRVSIWVIFIFGLFLSSVFAEAPEGDSASGTETVVRIEIKGNKLISDATIISQIKLRAHQPYNENVINEDIKNLYATGYFETVRVTREKSVQGIVVIFELKEKPVLKKITISGARYIRKKKIEESIDIKEGEFVDEYTLKEATSKIKDLYIKKGFSRVVVDYDLKVSDKNEAEVSFNIQENRVVKTRDVQFKGNKTFSRRRLLKIIKTRPAWLFNPSIFKEDVFADDLKRLADFYKSEGFSDVTIKDKVEFRPEGVYVTLTINEGKRYHIGTLRVEGNQEISLGEIKKAMQLKEGGVYSEQAIYEESSRIREAYIDKGYIFSQIEPLSYFNPQTQKIDVTYKIVENEVAYVEMIDIRGNLRTKDKVIRRELRIYPQDRFDGKKVKKSKERLENLGFFEEIRFSTEPGSQSNWVDLIIEVKEAKTGHLSFGGGYSSVDEFVGFVEIEQRNFDYKNLSTFTGAGQDLSFYASLGTITQRYQLSFTNPWIFDSPVSFGFDAYKKGHKRDEGFGYGYEEDVVGGDLRLGREFSDYIKGGVAYRLETVKIRNVVDSASQELKDEVGNTTLSSGELNASFDSRDNVFSPSRGIYFYNAFQLFGSLFGGDRDFTKVFSRLSFYVPLIHKSVIELRLRTGFADPFSNTSKVPIYERFFAGGASTIRGYQERKVGPIDPVTEDPVGGEAMFVSNIEYTYPLLDFLKVAAFFDTGNVWKKNSDFLSSDLKSGIGLGFRVKTPIGPVSIDYGWPLDTEPGEEGKEGRFHFGVSRSF